MMEPLTSQRYVPQHHHYPRPNRHRDDVREGCSSVVIFEKPQSSQTSSHLLTKHHDPLLHLNNDNNDQQTPSTSSSSQPHTPFRLLSLPLELRRLIYTFVYPPWSITLDIERFSMLRSKFVTTGIPPLSLPLTSRQLHHETTPIRLSSFTGRLHLHNVFVLVAIRRKERFDWLRRHVRMLHFSDASVHPERWNRYYDNFPRLERLEIEFPSVVGLRDERCRALEDVLEGKVDEVLLESLDVFRLAVVDQLSGLVRVLVKQRYCLRKEVVGGWMGILNVEIELSRDGTRVVSRVHEQGVSVVTKQQFKRFSEL